MGDAKDRFDSNPLKCDDHKERVVYFGDGENVYQCMKCGCGYIHNLRTGENYG